MYSDDSKMSMRVTEYLSNHQSDGLGSKKTKTKTKPKHLKLYYLCASPEALKKEKNDFQK